MGSSTRTFLFSHISLHKVFEIALFVLPCDPLVLRVAFGSLNH